MNLFFFFLSSQRALNGVPGISNPITDLEMTEYANEFAYAMGNKDLRYPRWTNYQSGYNGWYVLYVCPTQPGMLLMGET